MSCEDEIAVHGGGEACVGCCLGVVGPEAGSDNGGRGAGGSDDAVAWGAGGTAETGRVRG